MFTSAAVGTPVHLEGLCVTILFHVLCTDMPQFPFVMADVILWYYVKFWYKLSRENVAHVISLN